GRKPVVGHFTVSLRKSKFHRCGDTLVPASVLVSICTSHVSASFNEVCTLGLGFVSAPSISGPPARSPTRISKPFATAHSPIASQYLCVVHRRTSSTNIVDDAPRISNNNTG